jgi:hypothetical protein
VQPGGKCKESSDCKGESEKNITERKTKLAYLAGGKDVFTLKTVNAIKYYNTFIIES